MDPVTAFSLASAVLGVVDFGLGTIKLFRRISRDGKAYSEQLDYIVADFSKANERLQSCIRAPDSAIALDKDDQRLYDLSQRCCASAKALADELSKLNVAAVGKVRRNIEGVTKTVTTIWKAGKLKELENELLAYRKALDSNVLLSLRHNHDASALQQLSSFESLGSLVQDLVEDIANGHTSFKDLVHHQHDHTRLHVAKVGEKLGGKMDVINTNVSNVEKYIVDQNFVQTLLGSLNFPDMRRRQDSVKDNFETTFEWIFDSSFELERPWTPFRTWLESGQGFYWISGKPGSGKSTLMKFIFDSERMDEIMETWAGTAALSKIAFFAWRPSTTDLPKSCLGVLRSISHDILRMHTELAQVVAPTGTAPIWTRNTACFAIFIDGLDELETGVDELLEFLSTLAGLENVRLCVSSRRERIFELAFAGYPQLRLQDLTRHDIEQFVLGKVKSQLLRLGPEGADAEGIYAEDWDDTITEVTDIITEKAQGVFLWVTLAIGVVLSCLRANDSHRQLLGAVDDLSSDLDHLYEDIISRVDRPYRKVAARYLRFVAAHKVSVLDVALTDCDGDIKVDDALERCKSTARGIETKCFGLLEIVLDEYCNDANELRTYQMSVIHYMHRTAAEHFSGHSPTLTRLDPQIWQIDTCKLIAGSLISQLRVLGCGQDYYDCLTFWRVFALLSATEDTSRGSQMQLLISLSKAWSNSPDCSYFGQDWIQFTRHINSIGAPHDDYAYVDYDADTDDANSDEGHKSYRFRDSRAVLGGLCCFCNTPVSARKFASEGNVDPTFLLLCTVFSLCRGEKADSPFRKINDVCDLIQVLLGRGADPNLKVSMRTLQYWNHYCFGGYAHWPQFQEMTAWEMFCISIYNKQLRQDTVVIPLLGAFLDRGADPNARITVPKRCLDRLEHLRRSVLFEGRQTYLFCQRSLHSIISSEFTWTESVGALKDKLKMLGGREHDSFAFGFPEALGLPNIYLDASENEVLVNLMYLGDKVRFNAKSKEIALQYNQAHKWSMAAVLNPEKMRIFHEIF